VPALFNMSMLLTTPGGSTYTATELAAMLADAGFGSPKVTPLLPTPLTLLLARAQETGAGNTRRIPRNSF
jgi:hypothetical protein